MNILVKIWKYLNHTPSWDTCEVDSSITCPMKLAGKECTRCVTQNVELNSNHSMASGETKTAE